MYNMQLHIVYAPHKDVELFYDSLKVSFFIPNPVFVIPIYNKASQLFSYVQHATPYSLRAA